MRLILIILLVTTALAACNKDKKTLDVSYYYNCHQLQNLDSSAVAAMLTGSWARTMHACSGTGAIVERTAKIIRVTFRGDRTFVVSDYTTPLTQGTWKLKQADGNNWRLEVSSPSEYLHGWILFCNNQVLFSDSYLDGCDNLFNKD